MPEQKLVFCDVDGTLLTSDHKILTVTKKAVAALSAKGVLFVISSGRTPRAIFPLLDELRIDTPFIASNGGYVGKRNGTCLAKTGFSKSDALKITGTVKSLLPEAEGVFYYNDEWIVENGDTPAIDFEISVTNARPTIGNPVELIAENEPVQKLLYIDPKEKLHDLSQKLKKIYPDLGIFVSNENMMEILPHGVSKAWGAQELCRILKLTADQTIAFGDGKNDMELLKFAGIGVAMGNASDSVKHTADRITTTNDKNGIAVTLNKIFNLSLNL